MARLWPVPDLSQNRHGAKGTAELLKRFGLSPDKSLGQHFLIDPNQVERIITLSEVKAGDHVVEVGPGLGALTAALVAEGANVSAVEIDTGLAKALDEQFDGEKNLRIINQDALKVDWHEICDKDQDWSLIANLPYNVGTPLVLDLLDTVPQIKTIFVMVQKEVAQRLAAKPATKTFGIPSVKVLYWGSAKVVATVPPSVFLPQPRVESALVKIDRVEHNWRPKDLTPDQISNVFKLVTTAFGQRRKMLRSSLKAHLDIEDFVQAQIDPSTRPDRLEACQWHLLGEQAAKKNNVATNT